VHGRIVGNVRVQIGDAHGHAGVRHEVAEVPGVKACGLDRGEVESRENLLGREDAARRLEQVRRGSTDVDLDGPVPRDLGSGPDALEDVVIRFDGLAEVGRASGRQVAAPESSCASADLDGAGRPRSLRDLGPCHGRGEDAGQGKTRNQSMHVIPPELALAGTRVR
jgi:hypothetical protein